MMETLIRLVVCRKTHLSLRQRLLVMKYMSLIVANIHLNLLQMVHACNPDLRLRGHNEERFGLSWSKVKQGHLLSGSDDVQICLWDINATPKNKTLEAMRMFKAHERVEDVAWHLRDENLFGSVGDDRCLHIWDLRSETAEKGPPELLFTHEGHTNKISDFSWNPNEEWVVASVAGDNILQIWKHKSAPRINQTCYA